MKELTDKQLNKLLKDAKLGKGLLDKIKQGLSKGADKLLQNTSTVVNTLKGCKESDKNPDWKYTPKPGEKHQILFTKDGKCNYRARFSGPGTKVNPGLRALMAMHGNDISKATASSSFVSNVDKEALAHDIRYLLSDSDPKLVRDADMKFVKVLSRIKGEDKNVLIPLTAMKAKMIAEDSKAIKVYAGNESSTPAELELAKKVLSHLSMQGYGRKKRAGKYDNVIDAIQSGTGLDELLSKSKDIEMKDDIKCTQSLVPSKQPKKTLATPPGSKVGNGKKANPWLSHLKKVYAEGKKSGMKYSEAMVKAKASYKK